MFLGAFTQASRYAIRLSLQEDEHITQVNEYDVLTALPAAISLITNQSIRLADFLW